MSDDRHERYAIPNADILFADTWADEDGDTASTCTGCGSALPNGALVCGECGRPAAVCTGSCSSCGSPVCVGEKRGSSG